MLAIKGLEKTSLIDYPGKISAVVFLGGCNFRCPFCHNREIVLEPEKTESIPEQDVLDFFRERSDWLDGVVVTGGEPTIHAGLPEFMKRLKALGYLVKLDTNGTNPQMLEEIIEKGLVDYITMDIKGPLNSYEKICGAPVDVQKIRESISLIIHSGKEHEFRSTILPGIHTKEDVEEMARMVKGARKFYLQEFRPKNTIDPDFEGRRPFEPSEMKELKELCGNYVQTEMRLI